MSFPSNEEDSVSIEPKRQPWIKKVVIAVAAIFGIVVLGVASIPLWFNIDSYRPQIVSSAEPFLNGKLVLGKLSLSVWGKFHVGVEGVEVQDTRGEKILKAGAVSAELPLDSIFFSSPSLKIVAEQPEIFVRKDPQGKLNLMSLIKTSSVKETTPPTEAPKYRAESTKSSASLPALIKNASVSFFLKQAHFSYLDNAAKTQFEMKNLNIEMEHLSLSHPSQIKIGANLDTKMGSDFSLKGPLVVDLTTQFESGADSQLTGTITVNSNLDQLEIFVGKEVKKAKGVPGKLAATLVKTVQDVELRSFDFSLEKTAISAKALLKNALVGDIAQAQLRGEFLGQTPGLQLAGKFNLNHLLPPQGMIEVNSDGMDLDPWLPKPGSPKITGAREQKEDEVSASKAPSVDASLAALKSNLNFTQANLGIKAKFKSIKSKGVVVSDLLANGKVHGGRIHLTSLSLQTLGGQATASGEVNLISRLPSYQFSSQVRGLDLSLAAASQGEAFRSLVQGKLQFQMSGQGESFDPKTAKKALKGRGSVQIAQARFASMDLGKTVSAGLGEALTKLVDQIPLLKGKQLSKAGPIESLYELISSDFSIKEGIFESPNFVAKAVAQKGLDLKGETKVRLEDCSLLADWQITDTYNLTKARDLGLDQGGVRVEHLLAKGNDPVSFPVKVEGTCFAPKMDHLAMTQALLKVALGNMARGTTKKITDDLTKKLQDQLGKQATKPLQDALKGIFGK
jgi:AsmA-like C-terminal region